MAGLLSCGLCLDDKIEFDYNMKPRAGTVETVENGNVTIRLRRCQFEKRSGRNLTHKTFNLTKVENLQVVEKFSS